MNIANKTILTTGANRGIGEALVAEAWRRGAMTVYAGTRTTLNNTDQRVTRLTLDVTHAAQIQRAACASAPADALPAAGHGAYHARGAPTKLRRAWT